MAYFHCLIGGGSSGGGYELTVTCDADFAGTTITCTDGVTTLTQTCPSASPYEVVFEIPNGGDWTISGVVGGHTVSTGVNIPTSASLIATIQQTVTIYSAKEDTISYVDIDGATQTITFASGETSKQVTIIIEPSGSSITFTSSVAKDPSNLSNDYSKTVTITSNTTDVYVMPDNALYWWGYEGKSFSSQNPNVSNVNYQANNITKNTNDINIYEGTDQTSYRGAIYATDDVISIGEATAFKVLVKNASLSRYSQGNVANVSYFANNTTTQSPDSIVYASEITSPVLKTMPITVDAKFGIYTQVIKQSGVNGTCNVAIYAMWLE